MVSPSDSRTDATGSAGMNNVAKASETSPVSGNYGTIFNIHLANNVTAEGQATKKASEKQAFGGRARGRS